MIWAVLRPTPDVHAWDRGGHYVVGAVAWEHMNEGARERVTRSLLQAPVDSDLPGLLSPGPRAYEDRARELFIRACYWADLVKDRNHAERQARYDEFDWHFVNWYWTPTPAGPRVLHDRGRVGALLHQLARLEQSVVDPKRSPRDRGLDLAWILHLVGDVHQPMHSSARVSSLDPEGDRGGNAFELARDPRNGVDNLHAYWDTALRLRYPIEEGQAILDWVSETADALRRSHPRGELARDIERGSYTDWSWEAALFAMEQAFPPSLVRGATPPTSYETMASRESTRRIALAGYRLADVLNRLFATTPSS